MNLLSITLVSLNAQRGITLVVALVMLLVMTTAGVTIITGATLQERIAGNQRQQIVARFNAEKALLQAENDLDTNYHQGDFMPSDELAEDFASESHLYARQALVGGGSVDPLDAAFVRTEAANWTGDNSESISEDDEVVARYIIEYMGDLRPEAEDTEQIFSFDASEGVGASDRKVFRITAIGYGEDNNVVSILESYFFEAGQG